MLMTDRDRAFVTISLRRWADIERTAGNVTAAQHIATIACEIEAQRYTPGAITRVNDRRIA